MINRDALLGSVLHMYLEGQKEKIEEFTLDQSVGGCTTSLFLLLWTALHKAQ